MRLKKWRFQSIKMFKTKTKITNVPLEAFVELRPKLDDARIPYKVSCNDTKLQKYVLEVDMRYTTEVFAMIAEIVLATRKEIK